MRTVHFKKEVFVACDLALVTKELGGGQLNVQVVSDGPEQLSWRPKVSHGIGRGQWHPEADCERLHAEAETAKAKAEEARLATLKAAQ